MKVGRFVAVLAVVLVTIPLGYIIFGNLFQGARQSDVQRLEAVMPLLASHGVTNLWQDADCEFIAYDRGAFVTDPGTDYCMTIHSGDPKAPRDRKPFDAEARAFLDEINAADKVGRRLQSASLDLNGSTFVEAWFWLGGDDSYVYEPGYAPLPDPEGESCPSKPVNANWYVNDC